MTGSARQSNSGRGRWSSQCIKAYHRAGDTDPVGGCLREHAGAASNIEDTLAPADRGGVGHHVRPLPKQGVDVLSEVLHCERLTGAVIFLVDGAPPWITQAPAAKSFIRAALPGAQHLISYHIVSQGGCWAGLSGAEPQHLSAGDILVVPHGHPDFLADPRPRHLPVCNT